MNSSFDVPRRWQPPWFWPAVMALCTVTCAGLAYSWPVYQKMWYFLPFTFLGNSLAPLPYDGAVIYLGAHYPILLVVVVGVIGTVIIEAWNMELLGRLLERGDVRGFRRHRFTQRTLRWYGKAPFWSLVATCALPIVPHYPMRVLASLARYPMWKYQASVILGRGTRYVWLATLGWAIPIPGKWIALVSAVLLLLALRQARRMNREGDGSPGASVARAA